MYSNDNKNKIRYITATSDEYIKKSRLPIPLQERLAEYEAIGCATVIDSNGNINCHNCTDCTNCSDCDNCNNCTNCLWCTDCTGCSNCYDCTDCENNTL